MPAGCGAPITPGAAGRRTTHGSWRGSGGSGAGRSGSIGAPTLVLHAVGDQVIEAACGRYMAARIPNARFVELPSDDHLPWLSDGDIILDEIERFVATFEPISEPD